MFDLMSCAVNKHLEDDNEGAGKVDRMRNSFSMAKQPLVGQGLLIIEASQSHSIRHTILGRTLLDEWSAQCRDLYLTTHSTYKRQTSMPPVGFEPTIPASEQSQTHALDIAVTEIGKMSNSGGLKDSETTLAYFGHQREVTATDILLLRC
jgi:hypothetical protein